MFSIFPCIINNYAGWKFRFQPVLVDSVHADIMFRPNNTEGIYSD